MKKKFAYIKIIYTKQFFETTKKKCNYFSKKYQQLINIKIYS